MLKFVYSMVTMGYMALLCGSLYADDTFDGLIAEGKYQEAVDYADEKLPSKSRTADVWNKLALANKNLGNLTKTQACYRLALSVDPDNYDALLGSAIIANQQTRTEQALDYAKKALEKKFTGEASWEYARACIALNRTAEATRALEKVVETDPGNVIANRELGLIYYDQKKYDKALPLLKTSLEKEKNADIVARIGTAYLETGDLDSAIVYLKQTLSQKPGSYRKRLDLARTYFRLERYLAAVGEFDKVVTKIAFTADDHYMRAVSKEHTGDTSGAVSAYSLAIKKFGTAKSADAISARHKVAVYHLGEKAFAKALPHLQFIADADPKATSVPSVYYNLADAQEGLKNIPEAIAALENAVALVKNDIEAYARLADLYERQGLKSKAKATYEQMIALDPSNPATFLTLGQYNLKAKKFSEAMGHFEKSLLLKKSAQAAEGLAIAASALNKWEKARDAAETAVELDPSRMESRIILYKGYIRAGAWSDAQKQLEYLVTKKPRSLEYWKELALCYEKTRHMDKLARADKEIIALDRKNVASRRRLAGYAESRKDMETAYEMYKDLSTLTPRDAIVFKNLARIARDKGDKRSTAVFLKKYLNLSPGDAVAQRDLGNLLYEQKDWSGALAAYRAAIKLDPDIKGFYKQYADLVIKNGQQAEVVRVLKGAIASGEADASTYTTLGLIYMKSGKYADARAMYEKALKLDPQNSDILSALAECQAKTGNYSDAILSYEQAVMMNPDLTEELRAMGDLYMKLKKKPQAIKAYSEYLKKTKKDDRIAVIVARDAYDKKHYHDAVKYYSMLSGKEARTNFYNLLRYGEALFKTGDYAAFIPVYEGLRKRNPKLGTLKNMLLMLGEAYEKEKKLMNAAEIYRLYCRLPNVRNADAAYKSAFYRESRQPAEARKIYLANTGKYRNDYRNYLRLGLLYSKKKATLGKAMTTLKRAVALADTITEAWIELSEVYHSLGKKKQEMEAYRKIIKLDPQNVTANRRLGMVLLESGKVTDGMIYLEMVNTIAPGNPAVMRALASGYMKTRRPKDAVKLLEKAGKIRPKDIDIRIELVNAYQAAGQNRNAIDEMKDLVRMKRDTAYLLKYIDLLMLEGKHKDAQDVVEDIKATDPENLEALMRQAMIQRSRKKYNDAIETYKEISYIDANYAQAVYERAEVYMLMSKPHWAETFYKRALSINPRYARAKLGLAMVAKARKNTKAYRRHLRAALQLDPDDPLIKKESRNIQ